MLLHIIHKNVDEGLRLHFLEKKNSISPELYN